VALTQLDVTLRQGANRCPSCLGEFSVNSFLHPHYLLVNHPKLIKMALNLFNVPWRGLKQRRNEALITIATIILLYFVRKVESNRRTHFVFWVVWHVSQEQNVAVSAYFVTQKLVECRWLLINIYLEIVVLVVFRLSEDFVGHRAKVVGESLNNFWIVIKLESSEICHVDKDVVVYLYSKVAALLDKHS